MRLHLWVVLNSITETQDFASLLALKKAMPGGTAFLFHVVINYLMTLTALWLPSVYVVTTMVIPLASFIS